MIGVDGLELTEDRPWNTSVVASVSDYLATHPNLVGAATGPWDGWDG